jgi:hypothetical protein
MSKLPPIDRSPSISSQRRPDASHPPGEPLPGQHLPGQHLPDEHLPDELSADDRALLAAARSALQRDHVPAPVRQRLFERVVEEAARGEVQLVQPMSPLVPVQPRGVWLVLGSAAAMAFGLVLFANVRPSLRGSGGEGPAGSSLPRPEQQLGDRIFQSALFRAPAPEWSGALPPADTSLFGERPFSMQSRAWQVKHWENLGADPDGLAKYQFEQGALCVMLRAGDRVVGGWPWLPDDDATDLAAKPEVALPGAPAPVALSAGKAYRLVFKAWSSEPFPTQLLIAVGHAQVPFSAAAGARVEVSTTPEPFVLRFVAKHHDPSVGVAFLANAGEGAEPTRVCLSDVTLTEQPR